MSVSNTKPATIDALVELVDLIRDPSAIGRATEEYKKAKAAAEAARKELANAQTLKKWIDEGPKAKAEADTLKAEATKALDAARERAQAMLDNAEKTLVVERAKLRDGEAALRKAKADFEAESRRKMAALSDEKVHLEQKAAEVMTREQRVAEREQAVADQMRDYETRAARLKAALG